MLALWTKNTIVWEILRKFSKVSLKIAQNALFWSIFKILSKSRVKFSRVLTKNIILSGIFEKIFKNFLRK